MKTHEYSTSNIIRRNTIKKLNALNVDSSSAAPDPALEGRIQDKPVMIGLPSISNSVPVREGIASRVKWISELTNELNTDRSSLVRVPRIHGRDEDKENIIKILLSEDGAGNVDNVSVLPIVGVGGTGKTTLAWIVYNDSRIRRNFDVRGWVSMSLDIDVRITKDILVSFSNKNSDLTDLASMRTKLAEELMGKRFFLVLDNVSDERRGLWDLLRAPFASARSGKIVVITQNIELAGKVQLQTLPSYNLACLSFEDCWSMFELLVIETNDRKLPNNLSEIGRKICKKCEGLPLAVKALASALRGELNEDKWMDILESELWELDMIYGEVLPALKIAYSNMPISLKQCFAYLSLFPKHYILSKDGIIRLWMSLGVVHNEVLGSSCFDGLVHRSMIRQTNGGFIMHEIACDLANKVSGENLLRANYETLHNLSRKLSFLSLVLHNLPKTLDLQPLQELRELRMLQVLHERNRGSYDSISIEILEGLFKNLNHLRTLVLSNIQIEELPESVGNLKQLHYLGLANTGISRIPESICLLYHLQTLDLMNCPIRELPNGIKNLINLRHLILEWSFSLCIPHGIGQLRSLQTLPRFDIGKGIWHCGISELKDLVNLRGELCIAGLSNVTSADEVEEANLQYKHGLRVLRLDWSTGASDTCNHYDSGHAGGISEKHDRMKSPELVLGSLKPTYDLEILQINGYNSHIFPDWLGDVSFTKLVEISLVGRGEEGCEFLPTLGQLPSLRTLSIKSLWNVVRVGREFCSHVAVVKGFQSLKKLEFDDMPKWFEWCGMQNDDFCSLDILRVIDCPVLETLPKQFYSSFLTKLLITDCSTLYPLPTLPLLRVLVLKGQFNKDIVSYLDLPLLLALKVCYSRNTRSIPFNCQKLPRLQVLIIHGCQKLQTLTGLGGLKYIKVIKISACQNLQFSLNEQLPPLLTRLTISDCPKLQKWKQIQKNKYYDQLYRHVDTTNEEQESLAYLLELERDVDDIE